MQSFSSYPAEGTEVYRSAVLTARDPQTGQRSHTYQLVGKVDAGGTNGGQFLVAGEKTWVNYSLSREVIEVFKIV